MSQLSARICAKTKICINSCVSALHFVVQYKDRNGENLKRDYGICKSHISLHRNWKCLHSHPILFCQHCNKQIYQFKYFLNSENKYKRWTIILTRSVDSQIRPIDQHMLPATLCIYYNTTNSVFSWFTSCSLY